MREHACVMPVRNPYIYISHICLVGTELNWERLVWFGSDGTYVSMHDAWHTTCFNLSLSVSHSPSINNVYVGPAGLDLPTRGTTHGD